MQHRVIIGLDDGALSAEIAEKVRESVEALVEVLAEDSYTAKRVRDGAPMLTDCIRERIAYVKERKRF